MIRRHAEVMAVGDAGERDAELARARDRIGDRQRTRGKRKPGARIDQDRAAAALATTAGTALPSARPLRRCVVYCAMRDRPCEVSPCASASTSARAVASAIAALAPAWRNA